MDKKVLVATDGSIHSERSIAYIGHLFGKDSQIRVTIFHVLPPLPPVLTEKGEGYGDWQVLSAKAEKLQNIHKHKAQAIMDKGKAILMKAGLGEEVVNTQIAEKKIGLARDIIFEAEKGNYDAVVIGRRGLSKLESAIMGSISTKIVQALQTRPVWVIDGKITSNKILMPMDASDASLKAVDHLGFMIDGLPGVEITLYHVLPRLGFFTAEEEVDLTDVEDLWMEKEAEEIYAVFGRAKKMLQDAGLPEKQVKCKIKKGSTNIARDILREAQRRDFGTIVMARRGISKTREFFMGSVSSKILASAENLAVWIVS
ncbi:MAG: universal stress protein [Thermodesulfobacteriota bacterium]